MASQTGPDGADVGPWGNCHPDPIKLRLITDWTLRARDPYPCAGAEPYRSGADP